MFAIGGGINRIGATVSGGTANRVLFIDASGALGQDADLTFDGTTLSTVRQTIAAGTLTTDVNPLSITATWNGGAVAFSGVKLNVTNTASDQSSRLLDLQVGGFRRASVDVAGGIYAVGASATATMTGGFIYINGSTTAPTGSATAQQSNAFPLYYETSGNKLWVYNGTWRGVATTATPA